MGKSSPTPLARKSRAFFFKKEVRILGVDDSPFRKSDHDALVIGVVFRGANFLDGVLSTRITVDGDDFTEKLSGLVLGTRHREQLQVLMLNGITFAGFNMADLPKIHELTGLPAVSVVRKMPDLRKMKKAIFSRFGGDDDDAGKKWNAIERAGPLHPCGRVLFQCAGIKPEDASALVAATSIHSGIPEPIRVAHLIAGGVVSGESRGGA